MSLKIKHILNRNIHNLLIHPIMAFLPMKYAQKLHNWHANLTWGYFNRDIWITKYDLNNHNEIVIILKKDSKTKVIYKK